jgi:hypothetical protein
VVEISTEINNEEILSEFKKLCMNQGPWEVVKRMYDDHKNIITGSADAKSCYDTYLWMQAQR